MVKIALAFGTNLSQKIAFVSAVSSQRRPSNPTQLVQCLGLSLPAGILVSGKHIQSAGHHLPCNIGDAAAFSLSDSA